MLSSYSRDLLPVLVLQLPDLAAMIILQGLRLLRITSYFCLLQFALQVRDLLLQPLGYTLLFLVFELKAVVIVLELLLLFGETLDLVLLVSIPPLVSSVSFLQSVVFLL